VYIIGEAIQVVRRFSVPDVNTYDLLNNVGIYRLPRVSCAAASADHADLDPRIAGGSSAVFSIYLWLSFLFELILSKLFINKRCLWNCLCHEENEVNIYYTAIISKLRRKKFNSKLVAF
jgi:hypothetical protein